MRSIQSLTRNFVEKTFFKASNEIKFSNRFSGKTLVNALYEPNSDRSIHFDSAMYKIGGNVKIFNKYTSDVKDEIFSNTIKKIASYGDIMYLQHPDKEYVDYVSETTTIPMISAMDKQCIHSLTELYTIYRRFPAFNYLKILFVGNVKTCSSVQSLIQLLYLFPTQRIFFFPYNRDYHPEYDHLYEIAIHTNQYPDDMVIDKIDLDISKYDVIYYAQVQKDISIENNQLDESVFESVNENSLLMHSTNESTPFFNSHANKFNKVNYEECIKIAILKNLLEK